MSGGLGYYAEHAERFLSDEAYDTSADRSWVSYQPVGVVLAIMPWNFPLWQVFRYPAPALMAGNAALLKHSPNTTGAALESQSILSAAGLPEGLFTALLIVEADVPAVTERLIADPRIGAVTITGSERAGSAVGAVAGREIKKSVLELGGSDPFIVLADADLSAVAALAAKGRFLNAGQSCISPSDSSWKQLSPNNSPSCSSPASSRSPSVTPKTPPPMSVRSLRADLRDGVAGQIQATLAAGATLRAGGAALEGPGNYYAPTVLTDVAPGMAAYDEEIFGPVATVITVRDADEAVTVANDTRFGLGASIWSRNVEEAIAVGSRITSGACFINAHVASDARMPFGGTKRSGYGGELASAGIREFVNVRTWRAMDKPADEAPTSE